ncbi:MAG: MAPEG family protein [Candidatus Competibacterales bacterium]|nr:MAPEG family protein [Candidatus Competibacterales bacterium]
MLQPLLALIFWTFCIWLWMYVTRLPAMKKAGIDPVELKRSEDLEALPVSVKQIADNYNHLHEQPTVFYALALLTNVAGTTGAWTVGLAWAYVALRVVHSMIQCTFNYVPLRFLVFVSSSIVLIAIAILNALALT